MLGKGATGRTRSTQWIRIPSRFVTLGTGGFPSQKDCNEKPWCLLLLNCNVNQNPQIGLAYSRPIPEILKELRAVTSSFKPGRSLSWKLSKFYGTRKIWPSMAVFIAMCFIPDSKVHGDNMLVPWTVLSGMVLCITTPNFRPILEIIKELVTSSLKLGWSSSGKPNFKFRGIHKNWPSIAILNSDLLHCTV